jgi:hypothetical protein
VVEETDESGYWMELIIEGGIMKPKLVEPLLRESEEILKIMVASHRSASGRR